MNLIKGISEKKEALKEYYSHDSKNFLKDFGASFLGAILPYAPLYALYENILPKIMADLPESLQFLHNLLPDMGEDNSKMLKLAVLPIVGFGGYFVDKLRLFNRSKFKKKSIWTNDITVSYANSFTNIFPYLVAFGCDVGKAVPLTLGSGPISVVIGTSGAYVTDILKNLFGFKPNSKALPSFEIPPRLHKFIDKTSSKVKYSLAGLIVAGSAVSTGVIFEYSSSMPRLERNKVRHEIKSGKLENLVFEGDVRFRGVNYSFLQDVTRVNSPKSH